MCLQHSRSTTNFSPSSSSFHFLQTFDGTSSDPDITTTTSKWLLDPGAQKAESIAMGSSFYADRCSPNVEEFISSPVCVLPAKLGEEVSGAAEVEFLVSIRPLWMNYDLEFQLQVLFCYTPELLAGASAPTSTPDKPHASLTRPQRMGGCSHGFGLLTALDVGCPQEFFPYPAPYTIISGSFSLSFCSSPLRTSTISRVLFFAHISCILELVSLIFYSSSVPSQ